MKPLIDMRDERGFTLIELSVAMILGALVLGTLVSIFMAFTQNAGDVTAKADQQADARSLVGDMVVELRQAVVPGPNRTAVEVLDGDSLSFFTTPFGGGDPVRVAYSVEDCADGICELWVRRYAADDFDSEGWTFAATPFEESFLIAGVIAGEPMFNGVRWVGDPKERQTVAECGESTECVFPIVGITLKAKPLNTSPGAAGVLEIREEVRLRVD